MTKFSIVASIAACLTAAHAQLTFNGTAFLCLGPAAGEAFCAGDSLQTNIIIRCEGTVGQPGNCNDNLAGVPPIGVKTFAPCFQTSNTSGDAVCTYNGVGYPNNGGPPFNITNGAPITTSSVSSTPVSTTTVTESTTTATVSTTTTTEPSTTAVSSSSVVPSSNITTATLTSSVTETSSTSSPTVTPFKGAGSSTGPAAALLAVVMGAVAALL